MVALARGTVGTYSDADARPQVAAIPARVTAVSPLFADAALATDADGGAWIVRGASREVFELGAKDVRALAVTAEHVGVVDAARLGVFERDQLGVASLRAELQLKEPATAVYALPRL